MKAVILAGGLGLRLSEETQSKPKPMVEIGGRPILWHIMKHYSHFGVSEFIVCLGYKGHIIKEYFANFHIKYSDFTVDLSKRNVTFHSQNEENWKISLVDTGDKSQTGERLRRVEEFIGDDPEFCFTYGDGLTDLDIGASINFHQSHGRLATITTVKPKSRFGALETDQNYVTWFSEKPHNLDGHVNGGYFVLKREIFKIISDSNMSWESDLLPKLVELRQLMAYEHCGFWQCMDTLRDKEILEDIWNSGSVPWQI